jgi:hypothetical protein
MTKDLIIIALILALLYLYYQIKFHSNAITEQSNAISGHASEIKAIEKNLVSNQDLFTFLQTNLNSSSLEELKTKLGEKTLDEILEENEDYEVEVDTLTRTKKSLEQDLLAQSNAFQSRLKEKDGEMKRLKEDLTSEKQQHKGSLARITKLTETINELKNS